MLCQTFIVHEYSLCLGYAKHLLFMNIVYILGYAKHLLFMNRIYVCEKPPKSKKCACIVYT